LVTIRLLLLVHVTIFPCSRVLDLVLLTGWWNDGLCGLLNMLLLKLGSLESLRWGRCLLLVVKNVLLLLLDIPPVGPWIDWGWHPGPGHGPRDGETRTRLAD
jgi:hypothetical protein